MTVSLTDKLYVTFWPCSKVKASAFELHTCCSEQHFSFCGFYTIPILRPKIGCYSLVGQWVVFRRMDCMKCTNWIVRGKDVYAEYTALYVTAQWIIHFLHITQSAQNAATFAWTGLDNDWCKSNLCACLFFAAPLWNCKLFKFSSIQCRGYLVKAAVTSHNGGRSRDRLESARPETALPPPLTLRPSLSPPNHFFRQSAVKCHL